MKGDFFTAAAELGAGLSFDEEAAAAPALLAASICSSLRLRFKAALILACTRFTASTFSRAARINGSSSPPFSFELGEEEAELAWTVGGHHHAFVFDEEEDDNLQIEEHEAAAQAVVLECILSRGVGEEFMKRANLDAAPVSPY